MIDWRIAALAQLRRKQNLQALSAGICWVHTPIFSVSLCPLYFFKAWLTEIHEYAQKDVVIMLLGNKVSEASFLYCIKRSGG